LIDHPPIQLTLYPWLELTKFFVMFCCLSFGAYFFRSPGDIRGSEQIVETLKRNGTTTQFWRGSADTADTAGILLA
jgi:hypothetical protein